MRHSFNLVVADIPCPPIKIIGIKDRGGWSVFLLSPKDHLSTDFLPFRFGVFFVGFNKILRGRLAELAGKPAPGDGGGGGIAEVTGRILPSGPWKSEHMHPILIGRGQRMEVLREEIFTEVFLNYIHKLCKLGDIYQDLEV